MKQTHSSQLVSGVCLGLRVASSWSLFQRPTHWKRSRPFHRAPVDSVESEIADRKPSGGYGWRAASGRHRHGLGIRKERGGGGEGEGGKEMEKKRKPMYRAVFPDKPMTWVGCLLRGQSLLPFIYEKLVQRCHVYLFGQNSPLVLYPRPIYFAFVPATLRWKPRRCAYCSSVLYFWCGRLRVLVFANVSPTNVTLHDGVIVFISHIRMHLNSWYMDITYLSTV